MSELGIVRELSPELQSFLQKRNSECYGFLSPPQKDSLTIVEIHPDVTLISHIPSDESDDPYKRESATAIFWRNGKTQPISATFPQFLTVPIGSAKISLSRGKSKQEITIQGKEYLEIPPETKWQAAFPEGTVFVTWDHINYWQ